MSQSDPDAGRYDGDLRAVLDYDPTEKKPYRVRAWVWTWVISWEDKSEVLAWRKTAKNCLGAYGDVDHEKHFASLRKAVAHVHRIQAEAEIGWLSRVVQSAGEARRERLL